MSARPTPSAPDCCCMPRRAPITSATQRLAAAQKHACPARLHRSGATTRTVAGCSVSDRCHECLRARIRPPSGFRHDTHATNQAWRTTVNAARCGCWRSLRRVAGHRVVVMMAAVSMYPRIQAGAIHTAGRSRREAVVTVGCSVVGCGALRQSLRRSSTRFARW